MKHKLLLLLMALAALQPLRPAARDFTYTFEGQTVTYTVISEEDKTCMVAQNSGITGDLTLPASPKDGDQDFTLTQIGDLAFSNASGLTSIVIPETVTKIGAAAFESSGLLSLDIPDSVTELGESFCQRCPNLKSVHVGNSVTVIPETAFRTCRALEEVSLPGTLKSISNLAFGYCDNLKSFTIPNGVEEIGSFPFYQSGVEKIVIGASVLQSSIASIFDGTSQIVEISVSELNKELSSKDGVLFNKSLSSLIIYPRALGGDYKIPSTVENIAERAFAETIIELIEIPNSVVTIGAGAFNYAMNLVSVVIPESVREIGNYGFLNCPLLSEVTIKGNLPNLGISVFGNCPQLKTFSFDDSNYAVKDGVLFNSDFTKLITCIGTLEGEYRIPDTVIEIADEAFYDCSELTSIVIPSSVTKIGKEAFVFCFALESVDIPNSIVSIGSDAFSGCTSLKHFYIPDSLEEIGQDILWGCSELETISLGNSVKENIILAVNLGTPSLKEYKLIFGGENQKYAVQDGVLFNKSLSKLIAYPLGLGGDYVIPSTVDTIGERAFLSSTITSITIPNSVTTICNDAFENSNYFTSLIIPESVKEIGRAGFYGCEALESVTIKGSLPILGTGAFAACDLLKTFIVEDENYVVKDGVLFNRDLTTLVALLGSIEGAYKVPDTVTEIAGGAFEGSGITAIEIPLSVIKIGERAFTGCDNLTTIKIPNSVVSLGESAFLGCVNLQSVDLSNSLTSIGKYAFQVCPKLTSISIPNSVTLIGSASFTGCKELSTVTLGNSIATIEGGAFMGCEKVEKVYAPSMESWMGITFATETSNPLYYGAELIIDNKSTDVVEIPEDTGEVGDYAFAGLKDLVEVVIANAVEKIGEGSFAGTGLENINIPQSVKEIGDKAFQNCKSLLSAVIGKIAGKLTRAAEVDKSELSTVGSEAFSGCENLDKVSIGSNVGSIGEKAFEGCGSITRVDCYSLIAPGAADDAFDALVFSQAELHVPVGYADVFESAPVWSQFSRIVADLDAPETLTLDAETLTLGVGKTQQLTATSSSEGTLTWESSDTGVATVSAEGLVTAIQEGAARIMVTAASGARAYCDVTVVKIEATKIELNKTEAQVTEGESLELTATIMPDNTTDKTITWSSSDETVATVDAFGSVSALKPGTTTITAKTANGKEATCQVTVLAKVIEAEGIELNVPEAEVIEGESLQLTATITPAETTDQTVTWTSSDENIATVDQNGKVTGVSAGVAVITAKTANGKEATCQITVTAKKIEVSAITLDKTNETIKEEETLQLTATVTPADATDQTVTWSSSDENVATVDQNGKVTGVSAGVAVITAKTANGQEATCQITVIEKVIGVSAITLDKTNETIKEDETLQLTATVTPADATDKTVTWSSSDETVATVDQDGLVTALKAGKATITARTANGLTAKCELTVETKTGIDGVGADAQISVAAGDGVIIVTAPDDAEVEVYSMTGLRVAKTREHRIEGLAGGVYIVRVGGKTFKVMVK